MPLKKPKPAQPLWTLQILLLMVFPYRFHVHRCQMLKYLPAPLYYSHPHLEPRMHTGIQLWALQVHKYKTPAWILTAYFPCCVYIWANLSRCMPKLYCPRSHPRPSLSCVYPWQDSVTMVVHTNSQSSHSCLWAKIQPCLLSQACTIDLICS